MKVRAKANGNIIDLPEDHPLIAAGIYERVEDEETEDPKTTKAKGTEKLAPAAPDPNTSAKAGTKVAPVTTKDAGPLVQKTKP